MMSVTEIKQELQQFASPEKALILQRFFKTGPGEYGEGDLFLGIKVPTIRQFVRKYQDISIIEVEELLHSEIHEERMLAVLLWVRQYSRESEAQKEQIFKRYLANTEWINNWDLVDSSAPHIIGNHLFQRDRKILFRLAKSKSLWERRIAMLATFYFIRRQDFADALKIAVLLLDDREDLMHKAVGWMLREIGERDLSVEENFLENYSHRLPRTALRYAIEKFPEPKRQYWLRKNR